MIEDYLTQRQIYLDNAIKNREKNRYRKSSELLWGAVTQTIKALAYTSGIKIRSHNGFRKYIKELSKTLQDRSIQSDFYAIESLHKNFYDEELDEDEFSFVFETAILFIRKIDSMIADQRK